MNKNIYHTHQCKDLDINSVGQRVTLSGWVATIRDHGGVLFLDLRDNTDTIQVVSNDDNMFRGIAKESVVKVTGTIRKRAEETFNTKLHTGEIELLVDELEVLGRSKNELPFEILTSKNTKEDVRLKYRYLDLRNKKVMDNLQLRAEVLHFLR
ncbi:MAG: Asp-tRNA(Asn)/Glu-tRNA(Gln) amidotransferase GatCAB subunit C, partial [Solobacterium sp.]|nr:Asp-tRNA(Asn)/Glu-tRNA(Gln) amidotransferase GatCAB subunit C [Solobacterium sp.]